MDLLHCVHWAAFPATSRSFKLPSWKLIRSLVCLYPLLLHSSPTSTLTCGMMESPLSAYPLTALRAYTYPGCPFSSSSYTHTHTHTHIINLPLTVYTFTHTPTEWMTDVLHPSCIDVLNVILFILQDNPQVMMALYEYT